MQRHTSLVLLHLAVALALPAQQQIADNKNIVKRGGSVFVDQSQVTTADVNATNGVVHIIDRVLLPAKAPPAPCATELFLMDADGKHCYEACAAKAFAMKGFKPGKCPTGFSTSDSAEIVVVCPDGTTNIKYCPVTWLKVSVAKKGRSAPLEQNIVNLAASTADLSTLVTALKAGKLTTALAGKGPFTVFAPTNEAFAALPKATLAHLLDPKNIKELQAILEYHVISGAAVYAEDLKEHQKVKTLEGQEVNIVKRGGNVFVDQSKVTTADVKAANGVVHIIDRVLLPPQPALLKCLDSGSRVPLPRDCGQCCSGKCNVPKDFKLYCH